MRINPSQKLLVLVSLISLLSLPVHGNPGHERIFPSFKSPEHLFVLDMGNVNHLLWPSISTIQGIVNRNQPRIYLIYTNHGLTWLEEIIVPGDVTFQVISDPWDLLTLFLNEVSGYVIYDPDLPDSINVATTMAGILNATVVDPFYAQRFEDLGIPLITDLRGRWTDNQVQEMYKWAHETYWSSCNHIMLGHLDPDIDQLRDFLVACRAFTFYAESSGAVDEALLRYTLTADELGTVTPVLGYFDDEEGFRIASECGAYVIVSNYAPSLTVHSSLSAEFPLVQERRNTNLKLEDKIYVSFMMSPNGLSYNLDYMLDQWQDARRGEVPLGWAISPFTYELAPAVAEWYYERATDADYFMAPPTGIGNVYPSLFPSLEEYISTSTEILKMLDLTEIWMWNFPDSGNRTIVRQILKGSGLRAVFESAPRDFTRFEEGMYLGTEMIILSEEPSDEHRIGKILDAIRADTAGREGAGFICVYLSTFKLTPSLLIDVVESLGDRYEVVSPIEFIRLLEGPGLNLEALDRRGNPIPGCDIVVRDAGGSMLTGSTDSEGMISFYVEPGKYSVMARYKEVTVNQTAILLEKPIIFSLSCDVFAVRVYLRDFLGFPAPGSQVTIFSSGGKVMFEGNADKKGLIDITGMPSGEYHLTVTSAGLGKDFDLTLGEESEMRYGVFLSIYSLTLLLATGFGTTVFLYVFHSRVRKQHLQEPEQPVWISRLTLDIEYQKIMDEIQNVEEISRMNKTL